MKVYYYFVLFLINKVLSGTHFFRLKRVLLNAIGINIGVGTSIVGPIYCGSNIDISIGSNCWIGKDTSFDGDGIVTIGNNVDIAPHCIFCTGGHEIGSKERRAGKGIHTSIKVEDGCWIGTNVTIINNSVVRKGTVIAAGSVVISDIEENSLAAGNPAKKKKELEG